MGLDLYAGTLSRYYSRGWETIAQRELGAVLIFPDGEPSYPPFSEVHELVELWVSDLQAKIANSGGSLCNWDELENTPYYSDKPDFEGYWSLIIWAAYLSKPTDTRPRSFCSMEELLANQVYQAAKAQPTSLVTILESELFVPDERAFVFQAQNLAGNEVYISTTAALRHALEKVNLGSWNGSTADLDSWRRSGLPAISETQIKEYRPFGFLPKRKKFLTRQIPEAVDKLQQAAQYAFSIYWTALEFAEMHRVPIVLDM